MCCSEQTASKWQWLEWPSINSNRREESSSIQRKVKDNGELPCLFVCACGACQGPSQAKQTSCEWSRWLACWIIAYCVRKKEPTGCIFSRNDYQKYKYERLGGLHTLPNILIEANLSRANCKYKRESLPQSYSASCPQQTEIKWKSAREENPHGPQPKWERQTGPLATHLTHFTTSLYNPPSTKNIQRYWTIKKGISLQSDNNIWPLH